MNTKSSNWVGLELSAGRYTISTLLGEGGMGFVYRAFDRNVETDVVVKVPRPAMLEDEEFVRRFQIEIRSLVRLSHPHIVKISDVGQQNGVPFAVMQYLPGGSLVDRSSLSRRDDFSSQDLKSLQSWLSDIAAALDYIHRKNYLHRDVKPDNVLFDDHENAYLSDFGIAKVVGQEETGHQDRNLTRAGTVLGTPEYMAPEVTMGQDSDGRADQYALGVVVYEMLTGGTPFQADTAMEVLLQHSTTPARPVHELVPSLDAEVSAIVGKAMSKDPRARFATCSEFATSVLRKLKQCLRTESVRTRPNKTPFVAPTVPTPKQPTPKQPGPKQAKATPVARPAPIRGKTAAGSSQTAAIAQKSPPADGKLLVTARTNNRPPKNEPSAAGAVSEQVRKPTTDGRRRSPGIVLGLTASLLVIAGIWTATAVVARSRSKAQAQAAMDSANSAFKSADYTTAIARCNEAIELQANSADAFHLRGRAKKQQGQLQAAIDDQTKAIALNSDMAKAYAFRGSYYVRNYQYDMAQSDLDTALRIEPSLAIAFVFLADLKLAKDQNSDALADCEKAIRLDPRLPLAYYKRGVVHYHSKNDDQAIKDFTQAMTMDPHSANVFITAAYRADRSICYLRKLDVDKALADCLKGLSDDPRHAAEYYFARASVQLAKSDTKQALSDITSALERQPQNWDFHVRRAELNWLRKDESNALEDLAEAINLQPRCREAFAYRALIYLRKELYNKSLADFDKAIQFEVAPQQLARLLRGRGDCFAGQAKFPQAILEYDRSIKTEPSDHAYLMRGRAYRSRSKYKEAISDFSVAIRLNPKNSLAFQGRGRVYQRQSDHRKAISDFNQAIKLDPKIAYIYSDRADSRRLRGLGYSAIADYSIAITRRPKEYSLYYQRGKLYREKNDSKRALADLEQSLKLKKTSLAWLEKGRANQLRSFHRTAGKDFTEAIKLNPRSSDAYAERAESKRITKDYGEAIKDATQAIKYSPSNTHAYEQRAHAYLSLRDYKQAIVDYSALIRKRSVALDYSQRGIAYVWLRDWKKAKSDLDRALKMNPKDYSALNSRGVAHAGLKQYDRSVLDYTAAIALNGSNRVYRLNLAKAYRSLKNYKQAITVLDAMLRRFPKDHEAFNYRGTIHYLQGNYPLALADFKSAFSLDSKNAVYLTNRANAYEKTGNKTLAKRDREQAQRLKK